MGIFSKNEAKEFKALSAYDSFLSNLLSADSYLSRKMFSARFDELGDIYQKLFLMQKENVLGEWCKKNSVDFKKFKRLMDQYASTNEVVEKHNDDYVKRHLKEEKAYLDDVLKKDDPKIRLDEEQRKVVLADEDYTLVIAGAGAGKTTTIEAKVKYLVEKKGVDPSRVLIVSFTRKATQELKERFERIEIPAHIATFHSIGNSLIKESDDQKKRVVDRGFMYRVIEDYLTSKLTDEWFIKKILLFFASYLNMPFGADNTSLLFKTLSANENSTMRSDLTATLDEYRKQQTNKKITINEERVRSIDECRIANYLFINGIDYVYEPVYPYGFHDSIKPYCPDFLIKYQGQEIYLEHFGLSEEGTNNRFSKAEVERYKEHVNEKIKLHREHGTKLIYTFSSYKDGLDLITHLDAELAKAGIEKNTKSSTEIYRQIVTKAQDKYFNKLILLICNFINRFKVNNFDANTKFDEWQFSTKNVRTKLFLEIASQCFHVYEARRMEEGAIDFEDMINDASNILDQCIRNHEMLPYDYILVDEYQDISLQRFDLCQKLSQASQAKIVAVGDDWQSIFRFSGAQIDLFTKFEQRMGYANIQKITRTYRNSQELIDIAGGFIMENAKQIKKSLHSDKTIKDPVILMSYDDKYERDSLQHGPFYRMGEAIEKSLDDIVAQNGEEKSVLLIGRYNFDGKNLAKLEDFFVWEAGQLRSKKYPHLDISFMTAHASKGLGRDNVIIINGKDDVLGFPSKIEDDPVMKLVIKEDDDMDFEEERRLFYVALTRTKNRVYIITPQTKPSSFIMELKNRFTNITLRGVELVPSNDVPLKFHCPVCGYPLQKRRSNLATKSDIKQLWICSNDPEVCGFLTNDLMGNPTKLSICKCPECYDGFLIVKPMKNAGKDTGRRMLGCTNYKSDGTGCNAMILPHDFTQDSSRLLVDEHGRLHNSSTKPIYNDVLRNVATIYAKHKSFHFSYMCLIRFLNGESDKSIEAFHLGEESGYGMLKTKKPGFAHTVVKALIELGAIEEFKNEKGYRNLELKMTKLTDEQLLILSKASKKS